MKRFSVSLLLLCFAWMLQAQTTYQIDKDISYIPASETDAYRKERCKLDVYYPVGKKDFPTVVWFHGGGLEGGNKHIPKELTEQGFAVVTVNYRLSPRATNPAYTVDAAEAVAWAFRNVATYGGRTDRIFVSGHSAGGYLALMLALDKRYLNAYGVDADSVAAYLPISGQTLTHYTIRKERALNTNLPVADEYAPANHARKDTPPMVLIAGDKNLEMMARYEENALLYAVLKGVGNDKVQLYEMQGFDHGRVVAPGCLFMVDYIKKFGK